MNNNKNNGTDAARNCARLLVEKACGLGWLLGGHYDEDMHGEREWLRYFKNLRNGAVVNLPADPMSGMSPEEIIEACQNQVDFDREQAEAGDNGCDWEAMREEAQELADQLQMYWEDLAESGALDDLDEQLREEAEAN